MQHKLVDSTVHPATRVVWFNGLDVVSDHFPLVIDSVIIPKLHSVFITDKQKQYKRKQKKTPSFWKLRFLTNVSFVDLFLQIYCTKGWNWANVLCLDFDIWSIHQIIYILYECDSYWYTHTYTQVCAFVFICISTNVGPFWIGRREMKLNAVITEILLDGIFTTNDSRYLNLFCIRLIILGLNSCLICSVWSCCPPTFSDYKNAFWKNCEIQAQNLFPPKPASVSPFSAAV